MKITLKELRNKYLYNCEHYRRREHITDFLQYIRRTLEDQSEEKAIYLYGKKDRILCKYENSIRLFKD